MSNPDIKAAAKRAARDVMAARDALRSGKIDAAYLQPGTMDNPGLTVTGIGRSGGGISAQHRYVFRDGHMICIMDHECAERES